MGKIGLGLITCNAPEKLKQSAPSVPDFLDEFVIVNDGKPYNASIYPSKAHLIQHEQNKGVAVSKNDALRYLLDSGCEHIFLMEDDVIIKNKAVFKKYINTAKLSGILHLNYALQGPHNRKQKIQLIYEPLSLKNKIKYYLSFGKKTKYLIPKPLSPHDRAKLSETSSPNPQLVYKVRDNIKLSLYQNCVGAFSYYHRSVLEQAGLMDENFYNAWEHVEHTYQIAKKGLTTPFWWFADISNSQKYIKNIKNCMAKSTIASSPKWSENIKKGEMYFIEKEGMPIVQIAKPSEEKVIQFLNNKKSTQQ